jgi:hypothetical protein
MLGAAAAAAAAVSTMLGPVATAAAVAVQPQHPHGAHVKLPERIIAGYANWGQCDEKLVQAAQDGMNVLIWFSINLARDDEGNMAITGPATGAEYFDCVAGRVAEMEALGLDVLHLVSIGGWNSPHPATDFSGAQWWEFWKGWNAQQVARPEQGWAGFAGFDWDVEGNDDPANPGNNFAVATLDLMGDMSAAAHSEGWIVAMAPAQSYLDPTTSEFRCAGVAPQPCGSLFWGAGISTWHVCSGYETEECHG